MHSRRSLLVLVSLLALLLACSLAIPSSYDIRVTVGTNADELERHPIYIKMAVDANGDLVLTPEDAHMLILSIKVSKVSKVLQLSPSSMLSAVAVHAPPAARTPVGWHYFVVTSADTNVDYYIAHPDKATLESIHHKITVVPFMSTAAGSNRKTNDSGLASVVTNVLVELLERADIRKIEADLVQRLVSMVF